MTHMPVVEIIPFEAHHQPDFKKLNIEWLTHYRLLESHDLEILDSPQQNILDRGGFIYLAECEGKIVGTAALMKEHAGIYELVKMTVAEPYKGQGISKLLLNRCLQQAKALKAKKIFLFSNDQLKAALRLYEQYGFKYITVENSPFKTANIKMELLL